MPREEKATNREGVAAYWAKKYGEPIDCPELRRAASLAVVERERSDVAALRILHEYSALLQHQRQQQIAFLDRRIHGEDKTLRDHLKDELEAGGAKAERGRSNRIESYLALLEGRVGRTKRGRPRSNVLGLARFAHPAELLQALQIGQRRTAFRTDEMVRELLHRHPAWHWQVETRAMDVALAHAAHEVAEWIRPRHRNRGHTLDGYTSWDDVVRCLQWYGHDLANVGSDPALAIRKLVTRWIAKRGTGREPETKRNKKSKK